MKKIIISLFFIFFLINSSFAIDEQTSVYMEKNKFGLEKGETKITQAIYSKLIPLQDETYIFMYKSKFGLISKDGEVLVDAKYMTAQRFLGRFAKFGLNGHYVLYDQTGDLILDDNYQNIQLLYGKMFLVKKNYLYGLVSYDGDIILAPIADDIYMPKLNIIKIKLDGSWYEIEKTGNSTLELPDFIEAFENEDNSFTITKIVESPVASASYGVVSASDYFIKIFSSISPAYEDTIDDLILSHGADTADIIVKAGWLAKFPYVYAKNYINNLKTPNNGPLSGVKTNLKNKINQN